MKTSIKVILTKVGTAYSATTEYRLHDYITVDDCTLYVCKRVDPETMTCVGHDLSDTQYWDKCLDLSDAVSKANAATTATKTAISNAATATANANTATANADTATAKANTAASNADTATSKANTATTNANTATTKATTAATNADAATAKATTAATNADNATAAAKTATTNADNATAKAKEATDNADTATANATAATTAAETATAAAKEATDNADTATTAAKEATANAETATTNAQTATAAAKEATDKVLDTLGIIVPTGLEVEYPSRLTLGNMQDHYIKAVLSPDTAMQNLIYMSDNKAVEVALDGRITVTNKGVSRVHVIPTCNTALARTLLIEVVGPPLRLVTTRQQMRFTQSGGLRFN